MSTACGNFKPHVWKPRQCAACFRPKSEHSDVNGGSNSNSNGTISTVRTKQTPYYTRYSVGDEDELGEKAASEDKTQDNYCTREHGSSPSSTSAEVVQSQKPDSEDEINKKQLPRQVPVVNSGDSVSNLGAVSDTSQVPNEATSDVNMLQSRPRPPPPRARSQTLAFPRVKPRKQVSEPVVQMPLSTMTLPRDLQLPFPVPTPRRRKSTSPEPASLHNESNNLSKAKSLEDLDGTSTNAKSAPKVTFKSETVTIPDHKPDTSPGLAKKNTVVEPYAVSDVKDILHKKATEGIVHDKNGGSNLEKSAEVDDHEYIEPDTWNATVVSIRALKDQKSLQQNGKPPQMTKYATLNSLQPTTSQQNGGLTVNAHVKQKAVSIKKSSPPVRRPAPAPPGGARKRSLTTTSVDKDHLLQNYSIPCRPPAPLNYVNSEVERPPNAPVSMKPPAKPKRTLSTFDDYENINGVDDGEVIDEVIVEEVAPLDDSTLSRPKKPVRMPKEATLTRGSSAGPSSQPAMKGKYIDLDIDQLGADQALQQIVGEQKPIMKYQNFDDFSPQPTPDIKSPDSSSLNALVLSQPLEGAAQVLDAMINSLSVASAELTKSFFDRFTYTGAMLCSKWGDFSPAGLVPPEISPCVKYNGKLFSLQDFSKERVQCEKAISSSLPAHPHICRALAFFTESPPSKLGHKFKLKKGSDHAIAVTDWVPIVTATDFVRNNIRSMDTLEYDRHVLLIMLQLFSALKHLHQNGIVHRDLCADTCRYDPKSGIMKLTDFTYALQRPPPISASTFHYGYSELIWLGGTGSKLPPEIINTPDDCQTLDYGMSDSFAAGCMIYELYGMQPPFDEDETLITKKYTRDDLPCIPNRSQYSDLINQLVYLLLQVDSSKRIELYTACVLVQAILWAPVSWIHGTVTEAAVQSYLAVEKARVVTNIALNSLKGDGKPTIELVLKNIFIQECSPSYLMNALSLLNIE